LKNGVATILSGNLADGIAVNDNDVYNVGTTISSSGGEVATLWKNGVPTQLTNGSLQSQANGIVISGGAVYIAGTVDGKVTYRKNGVATITPKDGATVATIGNSIAVK
jgi:hypothetical protein